MTCRSKESRHSDASAKRFHQSNRIDTGIDETHGTRTRKEQSISRTVTQPPSLPEIQKKNHTQFVTLTHEVLETCQRVTG